MIILKFIYKSVNWKLGAIGGVLMGSVAYYINRNSGFDAAMVPALKQFFYTLLVGGSLVKVTQKISVALKHKYLSIFLAILTPTVITAVLISAIHLFKGTPNPYETIFYTVLAAPPGVILIAIVTRQRYEKKRKRKTT